MRKLTDGVSINVSSSLTQQKTSNTNGKTHERQHSSNARDPNEDSSTHPAPEKSLERFGRRTKLCNLGNEATFCQLSTKFLWAAGVYTCKWITENRETPLAASGAAATNCQPV
jgi:predicted nicotinamide N-methyase